MKMDLILLLLMLFVGIMTISIAFLAITNQIIFKMA